MLSLDGFRNFSVTEDQKAERVRLSRQNLRIYEANEEEFLVRFVTMDETWVHYFDPETKKTVDGVEASRFSYPKEGAEVNYSRKGDGFCFLGL